MFSFNTVDEVLQSLSLSCSLGGCCVILFIVGSFWSSSDPAEREGDDTTDSGQRQRGGSGVQAGSTPP